MPRSRGRAGILNQWVCRPDSVGPGPVLVRIQSGFVGVYGWSHLGNCQWCCYPPCCNWFFVCYIFAIRVSEVHCRVHTPFTRSAFSAGLRQLATAPCAANYTTSTWDLRQQRGNRPKLFPSTPPAGPPQLLHHRWCVTC